MTLTKVWLMDLRVTKEFPWCDTALGRHRAMPPIVPHLQELEANLQGLEVSSWERPAA